MKKTLAIFSPSKNSYSETFIQSHRRMPFDTRFYYDGFLPGTLEGYGKVVNYGRKNRIRNRFSKMFSIAEQCLIDSLKKEKVGCVLAEYGPTACESLKVIKHLGLPLIVHFHGFDASVFATMEKYGKQYKDVFQYASKIIAVSGKMRKTLLNSGCPSTKILLNCYGPDGSFFSVEPHFEQPQFIAIGRFVDKKAPYLTVAAFKTVVEKFPQAKLIMGGEGNLLNTCKALVKAWGINNQVRFPGILNGDEIRDCFKNSIAFIQHSVTAADGDTEGTPVAILEAQAAGLPVVSTVHAGIPEVVINNETGLLSAEFDIESMAGNMLRIINEQGLASQLGNAGRQRIKEHFSMEHYLGLLEKEIKLACKECT